LMLTLLKFQESILELFFGSSCQIGQKLHVQKFLLKNTFCVVKR
jgi:hypothetical protein